MRVVWVAETMMEVVRMWMRMVVACMVEMMRTTMTMTMVLVVFLPTPPCAFERSPPR